MKRVYILAMALLLPLLAHAGEIKGAGANSCGTWAKARSTDQWYSKMHWLQGFFSSYNVYVYQGSHSEGIFGNMDHNAIASWVDAYCDKNPLSNISAAALLLIEESKQRQ